MQVSINTAVFLKKMQSGVSQYDCLKQLVGKPVDNIEVRGEFFDDKTRADELAKIKKLANENNWDFYFSIPEQLFNGDSLNENIYEYIEMAKYHGIKALKISMGDFVKDADYDLDRLDKAIKDNQVNVTIENQPNELGHIDDFVEKAEYLTSNHELGYTFDSGNWYWIEESPEKAFEKLNEITTVFHLKDIKDKDTVLLGNGDTDWKSLLKEVKSNVPVFLEYAIDDDSLDGEIELVNKVLN